MPIVSSHIPQKTRDCCCRSSWKRGRRGLARASIPRSANGRSQETWLPSASWKRRSGLAAPVLKIPPKPPAPGCCRPAPFLAKFVPKFVDPPFPFVGGVPVVHEVPSLLEFPDLVVVFVEVFGRDPPLKPPLPPHIPPRSSSMRL